MQIVLISDYHGKYNKYKIFLQDLQQQIGILFYIGGYISRSLLILQQKILRKEKSNF
uniref:Calcineurin-like phosphoesterase domain-containing protein n=1 Tax=Lepeophtheirus salmonis TaxID=72036 RepID=A0A0K2UY85_LEPSM